ncbi:hypothetical protein [Caldimonas brevitalea]|uniref:Uncharacterized protein n=1 Tax=Caldimonas brevitalea TaxID=413882 RepID=A0A0G3BTF3_9BURK|nr:hypothetical protein [Caldimonas brevitalea]AKJ30671.1 hypothetical protein AAW51_3980 [Caldimonas brevitalea]
MSKTTFSAAESTERICDQIWTELCDEVRADEWFDVTETANRLPCLRGFPNRGRVLRSVLRAVLADYARRPEAYEHEAPVETRGDDMEYAKV